MQTVMGLMIATSSHVVCLSDKFNNANVVRLWKNSNVNSMVSPKTRRFYKNFTKNCIFIVNECKVDHFYVVQSFWGGRGSLVPSRQACSRCVARAPVANRRGGAGGPDTPPGELQTLIWENVILIQILMEEINRGQCFPVNPENPMRNNYEITIQLTRPQYNRKVYNRHEVFIRF